MKSKHLFIFQSFFFLPLCLVDYSALYASVEPTIKTSVQTLWEGATQAETPESPVHYNQPAKKQKPVLQAPPQPKKSSKSTPKSHKKKKPLDQRQTQPYWVQVGAFSQESNASRLASHLQMRGYQAHIKMTKDLDHHVLYLVLIGDYKSDQPALKLAQNYSKKENAKSIVIYKGAILRVFTPEAPLVLKDKIPRVYAKPGEKDPLLLEPPEAIYKPSQPPKPLFTFTVGGLYRLKEAQLFAQQLEKRGYQPLIHKQQDINELDWWYTVEIGHYYTKTEAETAASIFFDKEHLPAKVLGP